MLIPHLTRFSLATFSRLTTVGRMSFYGGRGGGGRRSQYSYRGRGGHRRHSRERQGSTYDSFDVESDSVHDYQAFDTNDDSMAGTSQPQREDRYHWKAGNKEKEQRGGRHPRGLKGRDIGMFYAARSRAKTKDRERQERQVVTIDPRKEAQIRQLISNIQTSDLINKASDQTSYRGNRATAHTQTWTHPLGHVSQHSPMTQIKKEQSGDTGDNLQSTSFTVKTKQSGCRDIPGPSRCTFIKTEKDIEGYPSVYTNLDFIPLADSKHSSDSASVSFKETLYSCAQSIENMPSEEEHGSYKYTDEDKDLLIVDEDEGTDVGQVMYRYTDEEMDLMISVEDEQLGVDNEAWQRDEMLDERFKEELCDKHSSERFRYMLSFRKKLPTFKMRESILEMINDNQVSVISGETGCGKTTQVSQFILDDYILKGRGSLCHVVCTQPRRISAISVAERVAEERDERCGQGNSTGYQIRLESKLPRQHGSILYCTTGCVLKWLEKDPLLHRASHIILDEIHERDLHSDFLIIILKDLIVKRPDLKVILMSATLNADLFSEYFSHCPRLNIPGFTFPVKQYYYEDIIEWLRYIPVGRQRPMKRFGNRRKRNWEEEEQYGQWVASLAGQYSGKTLEALRNLSPSDSFQIDFAEIIGGVVERIVMEKEDGAILVFVPGWTDIKAVHDILNKKPALNPARTKIIPLHSLMPTVNQKEVFNRPPPGVRKIIIATNIAETSITIDDVVYVVDSGKIKIKNFIPEGCLTTLEAQWVAKANAKQRRGRAGRVQAGECYHIFTSYQSERMEAYLPAEMLRTRLEELCLQIKFLKLGMIEPFISKAIEPPPLNALHAAILDLQGMNALDDYENLTPLGRHLARMPVDPHIGKMILFGAMFCCLDPVLTVAASLGFKDAFVIPLGREKEADQKRLQLSAGSKSDHLMLINAFQGWEDASRRGQANSYCWDNFLSSNTLKLLRDMKRQFAELLAELGFSGRDSKNRPANINSDNNGLVKAIICAGLYPNVAQARAIKNRGKNKHVRPKFHTNTERTVYLHPKSVNFTEREFESSFFIFHKKMKSLSGVNLHDCSMISPYPLLFFGGNFILKKDKTQHCVELDGWILLKAEPRIATLVKDLRHEMDKLLQEKVFRPSVTNWDQHKKEGAIMNAIVDLITTEEDHYQNLTPAAWDNHYDDQNDAF